MRRRNTLILLAGLAAALFTGAAVVLLTDPGFVSRSHRETAHVEEAGSLESRRELRREADKANDTESASATSVPDAPPVLFGDRAIRGVVETSEGRPARDALVRCVPTLLFDSAGRVHASRFSTRTDAEGRFEFTRMPAAPAYELIATTADEHGRASLRSAVAEPSARIQLSTVFYERYAFFDSNGGSIDVSGLRLEPRPRAGWLLNTGRWQWSPLEAWVCQDLGLDIEGLADNELVLVHKVEEKEERRLTIPGFEDALLRTTLRPLAQWPASDRVTLDERPLASDLAMYLVDLPDPGLPVEWTDPRHDLVLALTWRDDDTTMTISRRRSRFVGQRGRPFELRMGYALPSDPPLEYSLEEAGRALVVRPRVPDLGYVSVLYDEGAAAAGRRCTLLVNGYTHHRARTLWPGRARIGPLVPGRYELVRWWLDDPRVDRTDVVSIQVKAGHNVLRW